MIIIQQVYVVEAKRMSLAVYIQHTINILTGIKL